MSDDEADPELLELLRQSLSISNPTHGEVSSDTGLWHSHPLSRFSTFHIDETCAQSLLQDFALSPSLFPPSRLSTNALSPGVLRDAEHIYDNAIDVSLDMHGTKGAAAEIYRNMQEKSYSTETWSQHELHPKMSEGFDEVAILNFVFTMDLLNFS